MWNVVIIHEVFQRSNRPRPILYSYLDNSEKYERAIKDWITYPDKRRRDLITDYATSHGFENDVVIFIQFKKNLVAPNNLLRAKCLLGIITFDEMRWH